MALELELQTEIAKWISRHCPKNCVMEFVRKPRHIRLGTEGLVWFIEALPMSINQYTFKIIELKRSVEPGSLSYAQSPELPPKFELLLPGFKLSMTSVSKAEEALDKMYEFSSLFQSAEEDQRWWIIVDAKITATACVAAREAVLQVAKAAAAISPSVNTRSLEYVKFSSSTAFEKEAIEGWSPADELWAASFVKRSPEIRQRIEFLWKAIERGDVLQWCAVQAIGTHNRYFEIVVQLDEFLKGDDVVLRIGVFSHLPVTLRVSLNENIHVVCSQEGVQTESSLGLGYLLPKLVSDYLQTQIKANTCNSNSFNVVEGLLRRVVEYLGLLKGKCVVCGRDRLADVPVTSTCENICKARKEKCEEVVGKRGKEEDGVRRREEYARIEYPNTEEGRTALERVLTVSVVERKEKEKGAESVEYEEAVRRVARMAWSRVASATLNTMVELWKHDEQE